MNIGLFIDIRSLYRAANRKFGQPRIKYEALIEKVQTLGEIYRTFAYGIQTGNEASRFIGYLHYLGIDTKYKSPHMGGWGAGMALDIASLIEKIDIVVIISNEKEIIDVLRWIDGKCMKSVVLGCHLCREVKEACNVWYELDETYLEVQDASTE